MTDEPAPRGISEDEEGSVAAERARRRAEVFGDVLPDGTRDERTDAWGDPVSGPAPVDEWLRGEVPPHHG